jgi:hypothetical protein
MGSLKIRRKPLDKAGKTAAIADFMEDGMTAILRSASLDEVRIIALRALCQMVLVENTSRLPSPEEIDEAVRESIAEWNKKQREVAKGQ